MRIFTNSEVKTKKKKERKKAFIPKNARIIMNSSVKPQKQTVFNYCKTYEKTVLAHEFWGDTQYFVSLGPRTALQQHRGC